MRWLLAILLVLPLASGALLDQTMFYIGDEVTFPTEHRVVIDGPTGQFRLIQADNLTATFIPPVPGEYTVRVFNESTLLEEHEFAVLEQTEYAIAVPSAGTVGVPLGITIVPVPGDSVRTVLVTPHGELIGRQLVETTSYTPTAPGEHRVLLAKDDVIIASAAFSVTEMPPGPSQETQESEDAVQGSVDNPPEQEDKTGLFAYAIHDSRGSAIPAQARFEEDIEGTYFVHIETARAHVALHGVSPEAIDVGFEEVPAGSIPIESVASYAINLDGVVFENGTLTRTAKGDALLKCASWNFTSQACPEGWAETMRLVPGQAYSIDLFPGDPGYIEIVITSAMHLDQDKAFIKNIYDETSALDGIWSPVVSDGEYVRIAFAENLTPEKDITVYARGNGSIQVFLSDGAYITGFSQIQTEDSYRVFLGNMTGAHDMFDLLVGGALEFDHIVDPVLSSGPPLTWTPDNGVITDLDGGGDEQGNYTGAQANDNSYYAMGETTNTDDANSQMNLTYDIGSAGISPSDITGINWTLTYCHSGENTVADCDGDNAIEKTLSGAQDVWIYNFSAQTWVDIGDLNTANGESEVTSTFQAPGTMSDYVRNGIVYLRTEIVTSGGGNDGWLAVEQAVLTIAYLPPPTVSSIQCLEAGGSWGACSSVTYGDTLDAVRVACAPGSLSVSNVSFSLENVEDNTTFFNVTSTVNTTGYWEYNLTDVPIADSGTFVLTTICRENPSTTNTTNWIVPFGNLTATLITPSTHANVTQDAFFTWTSRVACTGGECGNVSAMLDPLSAAFVSSQEVSSGGTEVTSINVSVPSGVQEDDLLIAVIGISENEDAGTQPTTPSGWNLITGEDAENAVSDPGAYVYWRVANSTEPTSHAWANGGTGTGMTGHMLAYRGVGNLTGNPISQSATLDDGGASGCPVAPSVTTAEDNETVIYIGFSDGDNNPASESSFYPGGTTGREATEATAGGNGLGIGTADEVRETAGATGTRTFQNCDASEEWAGITISLRPSPVPGTKGIVPVGNGTPFYTTDDNPQNASYESCLAAMGAGDTCDTSWSVNATGTLNSTWIFFVTYSSLSYANVSEGESERINLTITGNTPPTARNVSISPSFPSSGSDLACMFNITDRDTLDSVTANVTWFRNSVTFLIQTIAPVNGIANSTALTAGNTSIGENWTCQVAPNDGKEPGTPINATAVTIQPSQAPNVTAIQCMEADSWTECENIAYGDTLQAVRASCTDTDGYPVSVAFNLSNSEDEKTFFSNTTTDNSTGFWVFNNTDVLFNDSGTFALGVTCTDNSTAFSTETEQWSVPWGLILINVTSPPGDANVTQNAFFMFDAELRCSGGECGNVSANARYEREFVIGYQSTGNLITNPGAETGDETGWTEFNNGVIVDSQTDFTTITPNTGSWMFVGGPGSGTHTHTLIQDVNVTAYATDIDAGLVNATASMWLAAQSIDPAQFTVRYMNASGGVLQLYDSGLHASETWTQYQDTTIVPAGTRTIRINFTSTSSGTYNDATADDANVTLSVPVKSSEMAVVNTTVGATPLYTTAAQPQSCYLLSGDSCQLSWTVNATGTIGQEIVVDVNATSAASQVIGDSSANLTLTITGNTPPFVESAEIYPALPVFSSDLNCTFVVSDANYFDTLGANVTWYVNGVPDETQSLSVTNGVQQTAVLGAGNTTTGETWTCGVTPYDESAMGAQVNASNVTILASLPPVLNQIECLENNSVWAGCGNLSFGDTFSGVRANCTGPQNDVQNVTFNFTNVPDASVYFSSGSATELSGWWYFYQNITMNNSGEFAIWAVCADNSSVSVTGNASWTLPWGVLVGTLVEPSSDTSVQKDEFFTFTSLVTCTIGECGSINATLDPGFPVGSPAVGTADSGSATLSDPDDEQGGSFTDTQADDGAYFAVGETGTDNAFSLITLTFNITNLSIDPLDIDNLTLNLTYCHSGENSYASIDCNGDDLVEKTFSADQDVWFYNYQTSSYDDVGNLDTENLENEVTDTYSPSGNFEQYMSSDGLVTVRSEIFTDTGGADAWFAIEYAALTVEYTKLKRGPVSTTIGATPFYTTHPNPKDYTNTTCLAPMLRGDSCQVSWPVNATGEIGTAHEFFVDYNVTDNTGLASDDDTSHIFITIVDATQVPPIVTLETPADGTVTSSPSIAFNCSATDNAGLVNLTLYGNFSGAWQSNGTSALTGTSDSVQFSRTYADGAYVWNCLAYDTHGNADWGNANRTVTIDTESPAISLEYPAEGATFFTGILDFNFTATDGIDTQLVCNLTVDGAVAQAGIAANSGQETSVTLGGLQQAAHAWSVTCVDDAGNADTSETRNFTILELPPTVELVTANGTWFNTTAQLQYNATDNNNVTSALLFVDGVPKQTASDPVDGTVETFFVDAAEGYHSWTVNVSDVSNLTDQAATRAFIIDVTPPTVALDPFGANQTNGTVTFLFTGIDNLADTLSCSVYVDGSLVNGSISAANGTQESGTATVPDGNHTAYVVCLDLAGNANTSNVEPFNVSAPPGVVLNSPNNGYSQAGSSLDLTYTPTDNTGLDMCTLYLNGQANQTEASPTDGGTNIFSLESLEFGYYNWTVACNDTNGLVGTAPTQTFVIDGVAPIVTLSAPGPGETINATEITFNYTVTDNIDSSLLCNLTIDGAVNQSSVPSLNGTIVNVTATITSDGLHFWNVTCVDDAGNANTSETRNFTTQNPPFLTLQSPADGAILNDGQDVALVYFISDSDGIAGTKLLINGTLNQTNATPVSNEDSNSYFVNLSDGVYSWTVNATDGNGLEGTANENRTLTVDSTSPIVIYNSPTEGEILTTNNVTLNFTPSDALDPVLVCNITVNGVPAFENLSVNSGSNEIQHYVLPDGSYDWSVSCIDQANNTNVQAAVNFTVAAPPAITLNTPTAAYRTSATSLTFNYTPKDAIGLENCTLVLDGNANQSDIAIERSVPNYFNVTGLAEGTHNWTVSCVDDAPDLNTFAPAPQNFTIDLSGPVIVLNVPAEGATLNNNTVSFNWTPTDFNSSIPLVCNLTLDEAVNETNLGGTSEMDFVVIVANLTDGPHNWSITCVDDLGNYGTSDTGNFTVNQPDLFLGTIAFNNTVPGIGEELNITTNVSNIGGVPAIGANVTFWDGNPLSGGLLIGSDAATLGANESRLFSVAWALPAGFHTVYVSADPGNAIEELNESNNNGTTTISALFVNITQPPNGTITADATPQISFNMSDFTGGGINYSLFIDGVANGQIGNASDLANTSVNLTALADGAHTIVVQVLDDLGRRKNSTALTVTIDTGAPTTAFITANDSWFGTQNVAIDFNLTDETASTITYRIFLNGTLNGSGSTANGASVQTNFTAIAEGSYLFVVEAADDLGNTGNSTGLTFNVDRTPPVPNVATANGTFFGTQTPTIDFTITDFFDPVLNYTFFVDDTENVNGSASSGAGSQTLASVAEGSHTVLLQALDKAGNYANSTPITIWVDVTASSVTLLAPANDTSFSQTDVTLNFSVTDNIAASLSCTVFLDGSSVNATTIANGTVSATHVENLMSGFHNWNVTCADDAANIGASETWRFFIELPDLSITAGNITFSNGTPIENQTVEINAAVFNIGNLNATNVIVQFWLGDPLSGGTQIGNATLSSLNISQNSTASVSHQAVIGLNRIYVVVDPPAGTNGSIVEVNESNNIADRSFNVGVFEIIAGTSVNELRIADAGIVKAFMWNQTDVNGSIVFIADTDSAVTFTNLHALGTNASGATDPATDDFAELDVRLGLENQTENVNSTWTSGGTPAEYRNITSFRRLLVNIPVVNSTNTTSFATGILWDADDGGSAYDGSQDVAFVSVMNMTQTGQYGTYDYEVKVPATLRDYIPGGGTITFYTELR